MCTKSYERLSDDKFTNTVSKNLYMIFNTYVRLTSFRTVFPLLMLHLELLSILFVRQT